MWIRTEGQEKSVEDGVDFGMERERDWGNDLVWKWGWSSLGDIENKPG